MGQPCPNCRHSLEGEHEATDPAADAVMCHQCDCVFTGLMAAIADKAATEAIARAMAPETEGDED